MKQYYVIHRNFVYHTKTPDVVTYISDENSVNYTSNEQEGEIVEKIVSEGVVEQEYVEPCEDLSCLGGVEPDHKANPWYLFDTERELPSEISDTFPVISKDAVPQFKEWASQQNRTVFAHMLISSYGPEFHPVL